MPYLSGMRGFAGRRIAAADARGWSGWPASRRAKVGTTSQRSRTMSEQTRGADVPQDDRSHSSGGIGLTDPKNIEDELKRAMGAGDVMGSGQAGRTDRRADNS